METDTSIQSEGIRGWVSHGSS